MVRCGFLSNQGVTARKTRVDVSRMARGEGITRPAAGHTRARSVQCAKNGHDRRTRRCVRAFVPAHAVLPGGRAHQIGAHASGMSRALHRDVARGDARHDRDDEVAAYHHALVIRLVLVGLGQRSGLDHGIVSIGRVHGWRAETDGTRMRSSRI